MVYYKSHFFHEDQETMIFQEIKFSEQYEMNNWNE
jgi:hypothetical protein